MRTLRILGAALLLGLPAAIAQTGVLCEQPNFHSYCEVREINLPFSGAVSFETGVGAITVKSWDNGYVFVRAQVNTNADDEYQARLVALSVQIETAANRVWASGPWGKSWGVSFEVFVPRECGLEVKTRVGAIAITDVAGTVRAETGVGAIALSGMSGDVEATTGVGAIAVTLGDARWDGKGLTVTTGTGAVHVKAPADYSAMFDLRTALGGIVTNFPGARVRSTGLLGKKLVFQAGDGGPGVRATTSVGQIELTALFKDAFRD